MAELLSLSDELLQMVVQHAQWDDQFNLAISCKRLHACAVEIFQEHREYHEQFGVVHDIDPLNIITVIRLARRDPLVAWHIRKIEIYCGRENFKQWTLLNLDFGDGYETIGERFPYMKLPPTPGRSTEWHASVEDAYEQIFDYFFYHLRSFVHLNETFFTADEIIYYRERLLSAGLTPKTAQRFTRNLQGGDDGPLKVILITMCPRLLSLVSVEYSDYTVERPPPMHLLALLIEEVINTPGPQVSWPMGLNNVRHVIVKERPKPWWNVEDNLCQEYCDKPAALFFLLPSLESLAFGGPAPYQVYESWIRKRPELASHVKYLRSGDDRLDCCYPRCGCATIRSNEPMLHDETKPLCSFPQRTSLSLRRLEFAALCDEDMTVVANFFHSMPQLTELKMAIGVFLPLATGPIIDSREHSSQWNSHDYLPASIESIQLEQEEFRSDLDMKASAEAKTEDGICADEAGSSRADAVSTPRAGETDAEQIIRHLIRIASAKPTTLPPLAVLCFRRHSLLTKYNSGTRSNISLLLSQLRTLCSTNQIRLHLSRNPNTHCPACDPGRSPFASSTSRPTGDEYGDLDFTWLTLDKCRELLKTKFYDAIGRDMAEEYTRTWAGPSLYSWDAKRSAKAQGKALRHHALGI